MNILFNFFRYGESNVRVQERKPYFQSDIKNSEYVCDQRKLTEKGKSESLLIESLGFENIFWKLVKHTLEH